MHERFTPGQLEIAKEVSRRFEKAWKVFTYPGSHSQIEVERSTNFILEEGKRFAQSIHENIDPQKFELLNSVFLGIFHRNILLPPGLKSKPTNLN